MSEVFKLAVPGVRVQGARAKDLIVDSDHPNPKISVLASPPHAGNIALSWENTNSYAEGTVVTLYSFPHGFQYVPTVLGNYNFNNGSVNINGMLPLQIGALGVIYLECDPINVNLCYVSTDINVTPQPTIPFNMMIKYYVFVEPGQ